MPNTITQEDVKKGIYIDFEGNVGMDPTLLGAYFLDTQTQKPKFIQYVHESRFEMAAKYSRQCTFLDLEQTFERLGEMAFREKRLFFSWSSREKDAISNLIKNPKLREYILENLVDCKKFAKKWKNRYHHNIIFPYITGRGRHRLTEYANLINYHIPQVAQGRNTGQRLRDVRNQLGNHEENYSRITLVAKRKWQNLLLHNEHDCKSMKEVAKTAMLDLREYTLFA
jgi:hypothetical protein